MKNFRYLISTVLVISGVGEIRAQGGDDLGTEEITVVKDYDPSISDAQMVFWQPSEDDTTTAEPQLDYSIDPSWYHTYYAYKTVPAVRLGRVKADKLYRSFARVGLGNYTTPLAEIYLTNRRSKEHVMGFHAKHLSSRGGIKGLAYNGYAQNDVRLWGKRMYDKQSISADLYFDHDRVFRYAFMPEDTAREDIQQDYQSIGFKLRYGSSEGRAESVVDYVDLGYTHFFDRYSAMEHFVDFEAALSAPVKTELFDLKIPMSYNNSKFGDVEQNYLIAGLRPSIISTQGDVFFRLGISAWISADLSSADGNTKPYLYPEIDVKYAIVDDVLFAYAGLNGALTHRTFRSFTQENPFLISGFEIKPLNKQYDFFVGMKGALSSQSSFNVSANYTSYQDFAIFINDTGALFNQMNIAYDKVRVFHLEGELVYQHSDLLETWLKASYDHYNTDQLDEMYHLPNLRLTFGGRFDMGDKFLFTTDLYMIGVRKAINGLDDYNSTVSLNAYADLNLGIEYRYSPVLSAFLQFNNLFAAKYDLWNGYAAQRFNLLGGFSYRF
jgi:hypothetical protein